MVALDLSLSLSLFHYIYIYIYRNKKLLVAPGIATRNLGIAMCVARAETYAPFPLTQVEEVPKEGLETTIWVP